jgi:glucosamine kinase
MILIGDSGSTKADWAFIEDLGKPVLVSSAGLNPVHTDEIQMDTTIKSSFRGMFPLQAVQKVYFYGAGCSSRIHCQTVYSSLSRHFPDAKVSVHSDMLGAARSLFSHAPGIACILGTGSNSCRYSGIEITDNVPPLGYIIGDEGSGTHIGKLLLRAYLRNNMPSDLRKQFDELFQLTRDTVIEAVYKKPRANVYLASFASFLSTRTDHEFTRDLVIGAFRDFFLNQVLRYPDYPELSLGCVGSVGYHFSDFFKVVARKYGCDVVRILKSPLQGLIEFHSSELNIKA